MSIIKRVLSSMREHIDVEMWQKGWWMLLLIVGTIGVIFAISVALMAKSQQ